MKGVVFTEFLGFVESIHGLRMVDRLISSTKPESQGAYTSVGTYDAGELFAMVQELSKATNTSACELVKAFGSHLFRHFAKVHSATLRDVRTTEQLLASVESRIHVDVRKLYPDAELPHLDFKQMDERRAEVLYRSSRPLADLAEGLITTAVEHFGDPITVTREDLPPGDGTHARFVLQR